MWRSGESVAFAKASSAQVQSGESEFSLAFSDGFEGSGVGRGAQKRSPMRPPAGPGSRVVLVLIRFRVNSGVCVAVEKVGSERVQSRNIEFSLGESAYLEKWKSRSENVGIQSPNGVEFCKKVI